MNGQWIQKPKQDTIIIFVHGILSSAEKCWRHDNGTYWLDLLIQEEELTDLGIYSFSYNTGIFSGTYSLNDVVDALKEHLKLDGILAQGKQLVFVCHSMGGIVVRKFIVERQSNLINLNIKIGLFLVASPSLGSEYANLIKGFAKILNNTQADALRFSQNNTWLNGLDKEFINLKEAQHLTIIGKELIEDKFIILKKFFQKQVVEPFSGARYFGEAYKVPNSDHSSITKPDSKNAIQHRLLREFIKEFSLQCADIKKNNLVSNNIITNNYIEGKVSNSNIAGRDINIYNLASQSKQDTTKSQLFNNLPPLDINFIGRITELETLNNALNSNQISIFCIIAAGGIGKTSLIQKWLSELNQTDYRIFAWSFYNQGANDDSQTSSIPFFNEAFKFFNYQGENIIDEQQRGRELATLIKTQNTILVLDGLEPLQHSPQADNGFLKDPAIDAFLTRILNEPINDNSLILISTRQPLTRFIDKKSYQAIDLLKLEEKDAIQLLKNLGVTKGTKQEFIDAVNFYGCHALALMLLGRMLVDYFEQDICHYREIPLLEEETQGRHAEKILNFYFNRWQDNEPEKLFLYLLGLFDRPMNEAEKTELFNKASIAQPLAQLKPLELKQTIKRLRDLKLLSDDKDYYDCHPIIRNYFGLKFKENNYELFKQAHLVLFDYFQCLFNPKEQFEPTLMELLPLYQAVRHGCFAEKYQEALRVYIDLIKEWNDYSLNVLGAYSEDLRAISGFFPQGWSHPVDTNLSKRDQGWLLAHASYCLRCLGRFTEAIAPNKASEQSFVKLKIWEEAAISAQNLVYIYLPLGQLTKAKNTARLAIDYEHRISHKFRKTTNISELAIVLHHLGNIEKSHAAFIEAEKQQQQRQLEYPYLHFPTQSYCALLLDMASNETAYRFVLQGAESSLEISTVHGWLTDMAYNYLVIARCHFTLNNMFAADCTFQQAVLNIQKSGIHIPDFYLVRADFYLTQNQLDPALADLNSALEIIERCGMKLYLVDYLLIHGRYCLAINDNETALNHYQKAQSLIAETGYHLRDAELYLLAAQILRHSESKIMILDSKTADDYLQKAKNRIEEIGQWGLLRVIERDFL